MANKDEQKVYRGPIGLVLEAFREGVEDWTTYIDRLEMYFEAADVPQEKHVATMLTLLNPKTYGLLSSLVAPAKPKDKTFQELVQILQLQLNPRPLEIAERFRFYKRCQHEGESVNTFCAELKKLSSHCNFGENLMTSLRDRFVCGLRNDSIQKRLLSEERLTYENAVKIATAMEIAARDTAQLQNKTAVTVNQVNVPKSSKKSVPVVKNNSNAKHSAKGNVCYRCSNPNHYASKCPDREKTCSKCNKKGHIAKHCRTKDVETKHVETKHVNQVENALPMYSLDTDKTEDNIVLSVGVDGKQVNMVLDTAAKVSVMPIWVFRRIHPTKKLKEADILFRGYGGKITKPVGKVSVVVECNGQKKVLPLYLSKDDNGSLFGLNWFRQFKLNWEEINFISTVKKQLKDPELVNMFKEYEETFQEGIGKLKNVKARLYLKENAKPVFIKPRPTPYALTSRIEQELERLVENGLLVPVTTSEWATPIVPIVKPDGNIRICGDFKTTLNPALEDDDYPLPRIEDIFAKLSNGKFFSKIDLRQAYLHMEIDEKDQHLTTLNTSKGLYKCTRLWFGLKTAPGLWQRTMEQILNGIPGIAIYLDDILIAGQTVSEHHQRLNEVLKRLNECGLKVNVEKSQFLTEKIEYCGHIIDKDGLHKTESKVSAILNAPRPTTVTHVKSFLGLVNYYGKFLSNLSTTLYPLHNLLKKGVEFKWTKECENSFQAVKKEIASELVLTPYNPNLPIVIATDASPYGLGAVLSHKFEDGSEKPIAFASRTLTETEQRYSQIDKEALAIVWGVKRFYLYLYARRFTLYTDHKPLLKIFGSKSGLPVLSATRMLHYALFLNAFKYDIHYKKSEENGNADALSRLPLKSEEIYCCDEADCFEINQLNVMPITAEKIANATKTDPTLAELLRRLTEGEVITEGKEGEFTLQNGVIFHGHRVMIPQCYQKQVLQELHKGHVGIVKMKALARSYMWWKGIDKEIEHMVKNCESCVKHARNPSVVGSHPWEWPTKPWERIHIDFAGPFMESMFLIIIDAHSKWPEVIPMKSTTSEKTIEVLRDVFSRYGLPHTLVSDNGPQFTSYEFENFLKQNGIHHFRTAPYHPATNGQAERFVQTFKNAMRLMKGEPGNLKYKLQIFLMQYRKAPHSLTEESPAKLFLKREMKTAMDLLKPDLQRKIQDKQIKQMNNKPIREFYAGEKVSAREYHGEDKWKIGVIVSREGLYHYRVAIGNQIWKRHVDQMRSVGENIPTRNVESNMNIPPPRAEDRNVVFPYADHGERADNIDPVPDRVEAMDKTLTRQCSENQDLQPPRRSNRVRKAPDRLNL